MMVPPIGPAVTWAQSGRRTLLLTTPLLAAAVLAACASPGADLPILPERTSGTYRLGAGDQLRVIVVNDAALTSEYRVSDTGAIAMPLVGSVRVVGRTTDEAEREIERIMNERELFNDPSVAVEVVAYRPVFVLGMVERGGQTPYQPGMTVLSAVAVVGGFNYRAVTDYVGISRIGEDGRAHEFRGTRQSLLSPGDVVNVFERMF
ncbi:polysaccharide export outer membrane protein [Humitalea rosea]|uniref:Polysaccharide export outer membrane protein n=1 Tax=Humitalea rosea TaxID=990373 RepID=A0A2W7IHT4_9PROT|nr:polysaccharide biosynthesis/export family protein [Humitalea rosea]PZW36986.1 polysaccharide export outer membrane protein [Humitalea rosea]